MRKELCLRSFSSITFPMNEKQLYLFIYFVIEENGM